MCTGGIFLCYCLSSVSQEYVYAVGFNYTSFLTLWCKLLAVGWGVAGGGLRERRAPHSWHAAVGFLTFATMWLSNQSLLWLNYPTQTVFKSAKLIPVMVGAVLINRKRFHILEYLSALALLAGLVAFTLTDAKVSPSFDLVGVFVICLALVADALIGNVQERMFHSYNTGASEMMTCQSRPRPHTAARARTHATSAVTGAFCMGVECQASAGSDVDSRLAAVIFLFFVFFFCCC